jgi:hypothetical protein
MSSNHINTKPITNMRLNGSGINGAPFNPNKAVIPVKNKVRVTMKARPL